MTVSDFAQILAAEMEADDSTQLCDELRKKARASLLSGSGDLGTLLSSGLNGKNFSKAVHLNAAEVLDACRRALLIYLNDGEDDNEVSATYPDFSVLIR